MTDNASNMKSAFKFHFPAEDDFAEDGDETVAVMQVRPQVLDHESIWVTLDSEENEIKDILDNNCKSRFAQKYSVERKVSKAEYMWIYER